LGLLFKKKSEVILPHCANVPSRAESWHPIPNNPKKEMLSEAG
jgi:hypothetical protein